MAKLHNWIKLMLFFVVLWDLSVGVIWLVVTSEVIERRAYRKIDYEIRCEAHMIEPFVCIASDVNPFYCHSYDTFAVRVSTQLWVGFQLLLIAISYSL